MKKKTGLSTLAITGLVLAASSPLIPQTLSGLETGEIFHSGGACSHSSHGCGSTSPKDEARGNASKSDTYPQNGSNSQSNGYNNPSNNRNDGNENSRRATQRSLSEPASAGDARNNLNQAISYRDMTTPSNTARMNYGADQTKYEVELMRRDQYERDRGYGYNPPQPIGNGREYSAGYQGGAYSASAYPYGQTETPAEIYGQQYQPGATTLPSLGGSVTLTEPQLLATLNAEGRAIYQGLDAQGKALAIQLASLESYRDKNLAVREAAQRMSRRSAISR